MSTCSKSIQGLDISRTLNMLTCSTRPCALSVHDKFAVTVFYQAGGLLSKSPRPTLDLLLLLLLLLFLLYADV